MEIRGQIWAHIHVSPSVVNVISNWFVVTLEGTNARIKAGPMGDRAVEYFEYGMLGGDSYLLIHYVTNLLATEVNLVENGVARKVKLPAPQKAENDAMLFLNDGRVPEYSIGIISPVWLAYCLHLDLPKTNHIRLAPFFSMGRTYRLEGGLADIEYTQNRNAPFFVSTCYEVGNPHDFQGTQLTPPSKQIFTNATYQVANWTNVGELMVPQHFYATNYHVMEVDSPSRVQEIVFEGEANSVLTITTSAPPFAVPLGINVIERRLALVAPLREFGYSSTNGNILNKEKLSNYENFLAEVAEMTQSRPKPRSLVFLIVIALVALPLAFLLKAFRFLDKNQKTKRKAI